MTCDPDELERLARAAIADNDNPCIFAATQSLDTFNQAANPATILALLSANREMRAGLEDAAKALEHVDGALTAMADAMATPAHGTWEFVTKAALKARSALTQRGDGE